MDGEKTKCKVIHRLPQACVSGSEELECNCICPVVWHNHCNQIWKLVALRALVTCVSGALPLKAIHSGQFDMSLLARGLPHKWSAEQVHVPAGCS